MTTEGGASTFKIIITSLLFLAVFSTTFLHLFFNKRADWKPYKNNNLVYDSITLNFDKNSERLFNQLKTGKIDNLIYINSFEKAKNELDEQLKKYHSNKEQLKEEFSFMGFISVRYFLYALGFALFGLTVSTLLLTVVLRLEDQIQHKRFFIYGCVGFIYISSFWLCHTLFATVDLPAWSYNISFIILTILVTAIIFSFIYRYNQINLKKIQRKEDIEEILADSQKLLEMLKEDIEQESQTPN